MEWGRAVCPAPEGKKEEKKKGAMHMRTCNCIAVGGIRSDCADRMIWYEGGRDLDRLHNAGYNLHDQQDYPLAWYDAATAAWHRLEVADDPDGNTTLVYGSYGASGLATG